MVALISSKLRGSFRFGGLRAFGRRDDGSVAVEFALVIAPFLAVLFAIMETALVFFAGQTLETAAADSARLILTGQAQTAGLTQATFKDAVCERIYGLFDCAGGVTVDVQKYSTFSAIDLSRPVGDDGNVKPGSYNPGGPCEIVVVRLIYQFPVYAAFMGYDLSDMSGNRRLLVATSVFRNEPYSGACT
ncbi:MAG TPA: TadE/TadG family type IV pilus assembly protein [Xanthobacteraceae bacterium]|nr:TadE/TadG family type IV pilus assembly protein [Xanthobacteraceae bacterium]